jgi:hypothetical protein
MSGKLPGPRPPLQPDKMNIFSSGVWIFFPSQPKPFPSFKFSPVKFRLGITSVTTKTNIPSHPTSALQLLYI